MVDRHRNDEYETYVNQLREQGILSHMRDNPLRNDPLRLQNGLVMVACGDCDRFNELYVFEQSLFRKSDKEPRIQLLTLNGGGLLIHPKSPLNGDYSSSQTLVYHIKKTIRDMQISDVILYGHCFCATAEGFRMTAEQNFEWLAKGASYIASLFDDVNVACNFHHKTGASNQFKSMYFDHVAWLQENQSKAVGSI